VATLAIPSKRFKPDTIVVPLTAVQSALWQLGVPILDASAVGDYKKRAKQGMLWRAVRWQLLAMVALVGFECLGRQWGRAAAVGAAAVVLATLFAWLMSASDLKWTALDYGAYRTLHAVPSHVSAAANALLRAGIAEEQIGVEYLKSDPILFVADPDQAGGGRYDLIIWD
jgi:hypothetical protein